MIPYVLLLAIPACLAFVAVARAENRRYRLYIGSPRVDPIYRNNFALPAFFILFFLLLALRDETVGNDVANYKYYFEVFREQPLKYFDLFRSESLYRLYNWVIGHLTTNFQIFLAVTALISVVPIALLYCEDRRNSMMKIGIFVSMSTFVMMFSGLRQTMAMALAVVAYFFVRKKRWVWFLITVVIALGFHHSAFMILFLYPLYHIRLKTKHLYVILPVIFLIMLFNKPIFNYLMVAFADYTEEFQAFTTATGAYTILLLFGMFLAFCYVVPDEAQMDDEIFGLRNILAFAVVMQSFASLHSFAMRLNYYFILFIPLAVAKCAAIPKTSYKRVAKWAIVIITAYFILDFLYKTYTSYVTGYSPLHTIPYTPFWA